jgi:hypothetical protein
MSLLRCLLYSRFAVQGQLFTTGTTALIGAYARKREKNSYLDASSENLIDTIALAGLASAKCWVFNCGGA